MVITFPRALLAGLLSFVSPCVLPLIPAYAALLIALSGTGRKEKSGYRRPVLYSLSFVFGFLSVFVAISTTTQLGDFIMAYGQYLRATASGLLALLGIYTLTKAGISIFSKRERMLPHAGASVYPVALFIGIGVSSGWTPCIGPTLGNILINASTVGTALSGMAMLVAYAFGLAFPFLLVTLITNAFINHVRKKIFVMAAVGVISGSGLMVISYILATDSLRQLTTLFPDIINY